jgi:hypothetical protein
MLSKSLETLSKKSPPKYQLRATFVAPSTGQEPLIKDLDKNIDIFQI